MEVGEETLVRARRLEANAGTEDSRADDRRRDDPAVGGGDRRRRIRQPAQRFDVRPRIDAEGDPAHHVDAGAHETCAEGSRHLETVGRGLASTHDRHRGALAEAGQHLAPAPTPDAQGRRGVVEVAQARRVVGVAPGDESLVVTVGTVVGRPEDAGPRTLSIVAGRVVELARQYGSGRDEDPLEAVMDSAPDDR